jgi:hypothetical protein
LSKKKKRKKKRKKVLEKWKYNEVEEEVADLKRPYDDDDNDNDDADDKKRVPYSEYARYFSALTGLLLVMYEGVTATSLSLLQCVDTNDGNGPSSMRLFHAGSAECYTGWQIFLLLNLACLLLPFPLLLILARFLIRRCPYAEGAAGHAVLAVGP